ncbi:MULTISPECIES: PglL family O-oligosaccharyltransferase [unclassified Paludibacterium]|uniref:PglL family O-oligosaccharyltransferase n=1 Tax=unclassified Paludibacterium TaxID=2618429 RepID=UPI001C052BB7|nr:O-antigen ligase family protein [Paludibacterium sp. B53371]BEV72393.1 PglL family O-oligosaccharyltransferase [Paludibacterium sp. THUN1379]
MQFRTLTLSMATLFWCLIAIVPFASPIHYVPLPQWWGELMTVWLAFGAGLLLACNGILFERLPRAMIWCLVLALCWAIQPWFVKILFPGMNYATALAFSALAYLAAVTLTLRDELGLPRLTYWLAWALMAGALVQSLIGLTQLTGIAPMLGGVVFYDSSHLTTNIFGHIGQRNQYAHYLMWGMIAGVYLFSTEKLRGRWFLLWMVWLSVMLAYAGSRTVLLYVVAVVLISIVWHARIRTAISRRLMLSMLLACAAIVAGQFLLPYVNQFVALFTHNQQAVSSGVQRLAANGDDMSSRRFAEMYKAWLVFRAHAVHGVGWSQFAAESVRLQALPQFANDGFNSGLFTNAHNLVLQLLAEMGWVITAIVFVGFGWVIWPYFSQKAQVEGVLPLACMAVTLIHSMVEYPLWYLYFLAMLVVFMSLAPLPERGRGTGLGVLWRLVLFAGMVALAVMSVASVRHYSELTGLYTPADNEKIDNPRIARLGQIVRDEPLYAFHALYTLDNYLEATPDNLQQKRAWVDQMAAIRPYPDVLLKQAEMQALVGQEAQAEQTLRLALASFPTYAHDFIEDLKDGPASWQRLRVISSEAYARLPARYRTAPAE